MYGYIYKVLNLINKRPYIGQHQGCFDPNYLGSGLLIKRAIKKYGIENFKVEFLISGRDKKDLNVLEREYIALYRVLCGKKKVYNLTNGGDGVSNLSLSWRRKIGRLASARLSDPKMQWKYHPKGPAHPRYGKPGKPHTERTKRLIRKRALERSADPNYINPLKGRHHSKETIERIREARKLQGCSELTRKRMSRAGKGKVISLAAREKSRNTQIGRPCPQRHPYLIPMEKRTCHCGCDEVFECKINSIKIFQKGHWAKFNHGFLQKA